MNTSVFHKLLNPAMNSKLFFPIKVIVSVILGVVIVLPVMGPLLLINEFIRLCYKVYLYLKYGSNVIINEDGCGSCYLIGSSKNRRGIILYIGEIEGTIDVNVARKKFESHLDHNAYSMLKCTLNADLLFTCLKKCDNFDIKNHVRYYPGTEHRTVSEKELMENILPELGRDMTDPDIPRWEEVIIPYYQKSQFESNVNEKVEKESNCQSTISLRIVRMHHSYMDGVSGVIMMANLMFYEEGSVYPYVVDPCKPLQISRLSVLAHKLVCLALFPIILIHNFIKPHSSKRSRFRATPNGEVLYGWTDKIPFQYLRSIKDNSGVQMSSVITTIVARSLRKFEMQFPNWNRFETKGKVHQVWNIVGMFPYDSQKPTNKNAFAETHLDSSCESEYENLLVINKEIIRTFKDPETIVNYWFLKLVGRQSIPVIKQCLRLISTPITLSNLPVSKQNLKWCGMTCTGVVGWLPLGLDSGLGIVAVRFADYLRYCVNVDSSVMTRNELDFFVSQIEQNVKQLYQDTTSTHKLKPINKH